MKILRFSFLLSVMLFLYSCNKEEEIKIEDSIFAVENVRLLGHNSNSGQALSIFFDRIQFQSSLVEYRAYILKSNQRSKFNYNRSLEVDEERYISIAADKDSYQIKVPGDFSDIDGNKVEHNSSYVVFVASIHKDEAKSAISQPSNDYKLSPVNYEIFVSDAGNFSTGPWQIVKFESDGTEPEVFIKEKLSWPQDILFLEESNEVLVSNFNSGNINRYNSETGEFIDLFAIGLSAPTKMKVGPDNLIYVLQWNDGGTILRFDKSGNQLDDFGDNGAPNGLGLNWDKDGNLFVSSYNDDVVYKFSAETGKRSTLINSNLQGPSSLWINDQNEIMVSNFDGNAVKRFNSKGEFKGNVLEDLSRNEGAAILPNGSILLSGFTLNPFEGYIKYTTNNSNTSTYVVPPGSAGLIRSNAVVIREVN